MRGGLSPIKIILSIVLTCNISLSRRILMTRNKRLFYARLAETDDRIRSARPCVPIRANSTRPAFLFTNNGNVKLTARPAIDTSAGRGLVLFTRGKLPPAPVFPPRRPSSHPRLPYLALFLITLFLIRFLSFYLSLSLISLSSFFLHNALRCT